ncbi:hypothetical protein GCM10009602_19580 [Nocardiopsis tropica]
MRWAWGSSLRSCGSLRSAVGGAVPAAGGRGAPPRDLWCGGGLLGVQDDGEALADADAQRRQPPPPAAPAQLVGE